MTADASSKACAAVEMLLRRLRMERGGRAGRTMAVCGGVRQRCGMGIWDEVWAIGQGEGKQHASVV